MVQLDETCMNFQSFGYVGARPPFGSSQPGTQGRSIRGGRDEGLIVVHAGRQ